LKQITSDVARVDDVGAVRSSATVVEYSVPVVLSSVESRRRRIKTVSL
jgi:hypothetical protein